MQQTENLRFLPINEKIEARFEALCKQKTPEEKREAMIHSAFLMVHNNAPIERLIAENNANQDLTPDEVNAFTEGAELAKKAYAEWNGEGEPPYVKYLMQRLEKTIQANKA